MMFTISNRRTRKLVEKLVEKSSNYVIFSCQYINLPEPIMELARIFDESVSWSVTKQKIFSLRVAGRFNNDKPTTSPKTYALMNIAVDWTTKYLLSISHLKLFNQWILRCAQYLQSPRSLFAVATLNICSRSNNITSFRFHARTWL